MASVDAALSQYQEEDDLSDFSRAEKKMARILLRRLRFLEAKVRETGGLAGKDTSGGAAFTEWEKDALEWALAELGFIKEQEPERARA